MEYWGSYIPLSFFVCCTTCSKHYKNGQFFVTSPVLYYLDFIYLHSRMEGAKMWAESGEKWMVTHMQYEIPCEGWVITCECWGSNDKIPTIIRLIIKKFKLSLLIMYCNMTNLFLNSSMKCIYDHLLCNISIPMLKISIRISTTLWLATTIY